MELNDRARAVLFDTQQWAIEELEAARVRVTNLRCGGESYTHAINAIDSLAHLIDWTHYVLTAEKPTEIMHVAPPTEPDGEPIIYTETPESTPEPEPEKPAVVIDISEVRTKAKEARDAGVKLPEVWKVFGGTKLSDVPAAKYGELMSLLDSKMKEIGG